MRKTLIIILGIVVIIVVAGFLYYRTSAVNISIPNFPSQTSKVLPSDFDTLDYSLNMIQQAENEISEAEKKLNEAKAKNLSEYDFLHRQFLENVIDKMGDMLDKSKDNLSKAKDFLEEQNYYESSSHAYLSKTLAGITIIHTGKVLEGKTKKDWNTAKASSTGKIEKIEISACGELYYFFSDECLHCQTQEIEINKLIINEACFNITKVDINKDMDLSEKYDIEGAPTAVFIDKNKCFKKTEGLKTALELRDWINNAKTECLPEQEEGVPTETKNGTKGEPLRDESDEIQLEDKS